MLKEERKKKGLTQEALAEKVGVRRQTISMVETGKNKLTIKLAKKIANVLEIDWKDLF